MEYFNDYSVYVDALSVFILFISVVFATSRGLVREILGLGSWVLAVIGVIYAIPYSQEITFNFFDNKLTADIVTGILVAISILVICTLISHKSSDKVQHSALGGLDALLGGLFGMLRGLLMIVIFYILATILFTKEIEEQTQKSVLKPFLDNIKLQLTDYLESYQDKSDLDILIEKLNNKNDDPSIQINHIDNLEGYKSNDRQSLDTFISETLDID